MAPVNVLTWLHLSDLHFGAGPPWPPLPPAERHPGPPGLQPLNPVGPEDLLLVLTHHPPGWLHGEAERLLLSRMMQRGPHLHLCGHVHEAQVGFHRHAGNSRESLRFVAGAGHGEAGGQHGYAWGALRWNGQEWQVGWAPRVYEPSLGMREDRTLHDLDEQGFAWEPLKGLKWKAKGTPAPPPVAPPPAPRPTEEPVELPHRVDCFGREDLVRQLVAAVLVPEPRPSVVLGPPGIGKSTLTIEALHHEQVERHFGARRYFVRLDGATSKEALVGAVAKVLGVCSETDLWSAVREALASALALLVLDNTETPWDVDRAGTEEVLAGLRSIPSLALVCSVRGTQYPDIPRMGAVLRVLILQDAAARELFCSIAPEVSRTAPLLGKLLEAQGGVPLAIKLLAQAVQGGTLEFVWQRWQQERTALLQRPGKPDRLSSLAVSLEVSINGPRLNEEARRLLSLLSWLPDGMAEEDVEKLLPGKGAGAAQVLCQVGLAFVEKNRLRMLAPIREYVSQEKLPRKEDVERTQVHYQTLARELGPKVGADGGAEAIARLVDELRNVEKVIERGLTGDDVSSAVDAANALCDFIHISGHGTPRVLQQAAQAAGRKGDSRREADCIQSLGDIALDRTEHEEARRRYEEAKLLYERVGDLLGQANCILSLGVIALERTEHEEAKRLFQQALSLYERIPESYSIGQTHRRLARMAKDGVARKQHLAAARKAWERVNLPYLLKELLEEFGEEIDP